MSDLIQTSVWIGRLLLRRSVFAVIEPGELAHAVRVRRCSDNRVTRRHRDKSRDEWVSPGLRRLRRAAHTTVTDRSGGCPWTGIR